jgi:hypothetical protein
MSHVVGETIICGTPLTAEELAEMWRELDAEEEDIKRRNAVKATLAHIPMMAAIPAASKSHCVSSCTLQSAVLEKTLGQ